MVVVKGMVEMLEMASLGSKSFNDFTRIAIDGKRLSSATVSKRLDELLNAGVIEETVVTSKSGRRTIAYRTTEKGKRIMHIAKELKAALTKPKGKK